MLISAICQNSLTLVQDPFGNYVVQYILGLHEPKANSMIIHCMLGRLNVLSRQKFSSNVVEKCLHLGTTEDKNRVIMELADTRSLGELLRDIYGNYVVQSALGVAQEPQLSHFLGAVRPLLPSLRASGQGRRIAQKLEKKYPQLRVASGLEASSAGSGACGGGAAGARMGGGGASSSHGLQGFHQVDDATRGGLAPGMPANVPNYMHMGISGAPHGGHGCCGGSSIAQAMHVQAPGPVPGSMSATLGLGFAGGMGGHPGQVMQQPMDIPDPSAGAGRGGGRQKKGRRKDDDGGRGGRGGGSAS